MHADVGRVPDRPCLKLARSFVVYGDAPVSAHQYRGKQCTQAIRKPRTTMPRLFDARRRDSNCGVLLGILDCIRYRAESLSACNVARR